jgi:hypothetical protein
VFGFAPPLLRKLLMPVLVGPNRVVWMFFESQSTLYFFSHGIANDYLMIERPCLAYIWEDLQALHCQLLLHKRKAFSITRISYIEESNIYNL